MTLENRLLVNERYSVIVLQSHCLNEIRHFWLRFSCIGYKIQLKPFVIQKYTQGGVKVTSNLHMLTCMLSLIVPCFRKKRQRTKMSVSSDSGQQTEKPIKKTPNDFIFGKVIGEGSFSTVSSLTFIIHLLFYHEHLNTVHVLTNQG